LRTEYRLTINALCGTISKDLYEVCFTSLSLSLCEPDEENLMRTNHGLGSFLFVKEITGRYRRPGIYGALTDWQLPFVTERAGR
jgi:hypothetical protein